MTENWKAVPGYEGFYEVSDMGRVRSLPRRVPSRGGTRISKGRLLKLSFPGVKYQGVTLFKHGVAKTYAVHRLVLIAFVGPPRDGDDSCHYNGKCQDNRLCNLRWDTRTANFADSKRLGAIPRGEDRASSKLTSKDVVAIRVGAGFMGRSRKELAAQFGISPKTVGKILRRETWTHVV